MRYRANVALIHKGDRIEKGQEIELSEKEAAALGSDVISVKDIPVEQPAVDPTPVPLEDMSFDQLKERAKELGLSTKGSKADLQERITLHLSQES